MSSPVVLVENLTHHYGTVEALADVNLRLDGPGVTGVLGPNGAGKTTLFDCLAGLSAPTRGVVSLFGAPLSWRAHGTPATYPRRRVGVVLQREFIPDRVTVMEYAQLFAAIYDISQGASAILQRAELVERARVPVERLSGGEAQRLFVAAAMVHSPELLLLDEPSAGLDPASKRALEALLRRAAARTSILLATHDLSEAERVCDRCLFIVKGRVRAEGPTRELMRSAGAASLEDAFFHYCGARMNLLGEAT